MSANITNILTAYGPVGVEVLKKAISQIEATDKTANSLRFEVESSDTKDRLLLIGRAYFELIEKGIKPSGKNPSAEMISFLTDYAKARGMDKPESAAWGIAKTILKEGDKTHRRGGRIVYSDDLDKFVEELKKVLTIQQKKDFLFEVKRTFQS